jgi:hypothetical protein
MDRGLRAVNTGFHLLVAGSDSAKTCGDGEHTGIAGTQATTADLIRQALQQQEVILKDQFKFQKQLEAQAERKVIFDLITQLLTSVYSLTAKLVVVQYTSPHEVEEIREHGLVWTTAQRCAGWL